MTFCLVKIISERHHKTIIRSDSYLIIIVVSILIGLIAIVVLVWFACKYNCYLTLMWMMTMWMMTMKTIMTLMTTMSNQLRHTAANESNLNVSFLLLLLCVVIFSTGDHNYSDDHINDDNDPSQFLSHSWNVIRCCHFRHIDVPDAIAVCLMHTCMHVQSVSAWSECDKHLDQRWATLSSQEPYCEDIHCISRSVYMLDHNQVHFFRALHDVIAVGLMYAPSRSKCTTMIWVW